MITKMSESEDEENLEEIPPPETTTKERSHSQVQMSHFTGTDEEALQIVSVGPDNIQYAVPTKALIPLFTHIKGVARGLEPLAFATGICIKQEVDIAEIILSIEMNNRYSVLNSLGQRLYYGAESTSCFERWLWGYNREFNFTIFDGGGKPVMTMDRIRTCELCFCGGRIGGTRVIVTLLSTGRKLGEVIQDCNLCTPNYRLQDSNDKIVMRVEGPACGSACYCVMCCKAQFEVTTAEANDKVGLITKHFHPTELYSDANLFGLNFEQSMNPDLKALLLATVFCLDFSFFEGRNGCNGEEKGINFSGCCVLNILIMIGSAFALFFFIYYVFPSKAEKPGRPLFHDE